MVTDSTFPENWEIFPEVFFALKHHQSMHLASKIDSGQREGYDRGSLEATLVGNLRNSPRNKAPMAVRLNLQMRRTREKQRAQNFALYFWAYK